MKHKPGQYELGKFNLESHGDFYDFLFIAKKSLRLAMDIWFKPMMEFGEKFAGEYKDRYNEVLMHDGANIFRHMNLLNYGLKKFERFYFVDPELWKIAKRISPDNLKIDDVRLPMPVTILYFINPVMVKNQNISLVSIFDTHTIELKEIAENASIEIDKKKLEANYPDKKCRPLASFGMENLELFNKKFPTCNWTDLNIETESIEASTELSHCKAVESKTIKEEDSLACKEFFKNLLSYLALATAYDDVEWKEEAVKMRQKYCPNPSAKNELIELSPTWIGVKKPKCEDNNSEPTGKHLRQHYRSAHWTKQVYGPKNSLRKLKWIDIILVNK